MKALTTTLLSGAIATGAGGSFQPFGSKKVFQAYGTTSAGSGSATVKIQASITGSHWIDLATITLTLGTTVTSDGFASDTVWPYVRANITALSGTDATVTAVMGSINIS